ncbi:Nucleolar protein 8 [Hordeum vulgare]|nr:Nucleolar protein 8 [Hordeum vulgare]
MGWMRGTTAASGSSFAYVDFQCPSHKALAKLFSTYNGCKWKGGKLKLEKAKEHYLVRLKREWEQEAAAAAAAAQEMPAKDDMDK